MTRRSRGSVQDLTAEQLRESLTYAPGTGLFVRNSTGRVLGEHANTSDGYVHIKVAGVVHKAHRLAFLYMTGEWPRGEVDHINGRRAENRWANLRDVTRRVNAQNRRRASRASTLGLAGVELQRGAYRARIRVDGKMKLLGVFSEAHQAHAAFISAKRSLHEGCTV